jgi:hypothetical protein
MSFETWIVDTRDKSRFRTLQVFAGYILLFFCFSLRSLRTPQGGIEKNLCGE